MSGAIYPLLQYSFMAWLSVKAQGQLYLYLTVSKAVVTPDSVEATYRRQKLKNLKGQSITFLQFITVGRITN